MPSPPRRKGTRRKPSFCETAGTNPPSHGPRVRFHPRRQRPLMVGQPGFKSALRRAAALGDQQVSCPENLPRSGHTSAVSRFCPPHVPVSRRHYNNEIKALPSSPKTCQWRREWGMVSRNVRGASGGMADTPDLGSGPARGGGSNPLSRTILERFHIYCSRITRQGPARPELSDAAPTECAPSSKSRPGARQLKWARQFSWHDKSNGAAEKRSGQRIVHANHNILHSAGVFCLKYSGHDFKPQTGRPKSGRVIYQPATGHCDGRRATGIHETATADLDQTKCSPVRYAFCFHWKTTRGRSSVQEGGSARGGAGARPAPADDAGGKGRANDVRLAEEIRNLAGCGGQFRSAEGQSQFQKGAWLGPGWAARATPAGGRTRKATAELTNAIQKFFIENSRLGIPVMFHEECLHGHAAKDATSFSQPIGLAATFNPELVEALYTMAAEEARARGDASGADAGGGCGAGAALGTRGGNLRRRPLPGDATGHGRGAGISGRRFVQGQKACHRHAETFCRPRPAGIGHELRAGQCLHARAARNFFASVQGVHSKGRAPSA